jgi:hypothetical protein
LLDAAGWDALEGLLGVLGAAAPVGLAGDLVRLLGWRLRGPGEIGGDVRLRLADLATDPVAALTTWIGALAVEEAPELVRLLRPLARSLTGGLGDAGALTGTGTPGDPWLVRLLSVPGSPGLATWVEPAGPGQLPVAHPVPLAVNPDRPGMPSAGLVRALGELAPGDPVVAALLTDRLRLAEGMDALVTRWAGSDGVVIPPPGSVDGADVPGIAVTFLDDVLGPRSRTPWIWKTSSAACPRPRCAYPSGPCRGWTARRPSASSIWTPPGCRRRGSPCPARRRATGTSCSGAARRAGCPAATRTASEARRPGWPGS